MGKKKPMILDVKFKGMSGNYEHNRLNQSVAIVSLLDDPKAIKDLLVGAQVQVVCKVPAGKKKDMPGQEVLDGMENAAEITGIATCTSVPMHTDRYDATLVFNATAIDPTNLLKLGGKQGTVEVTRLGNAKELKEE